MVTTKKRTAAFSALAPMILVVFLFTGCAPPGPRALMDGERLIHEGKYSLAIQRLEQAIRLLPRNAQAWNHLGLACHGAGQFDEAIKAYQQAVAIDRNLFVVHYNLGCLYLEQNNLPAALSALTSYTGLQANSAAGWTRLGTAQLRAHQLDAAEKSLTQALKLNPRSAEAQNGLGVVNFQRRRYQDAYRQFNAALREEAGYAPALLNLAVVTHQYLNNRPLALKKYQEYLALRPAPANVSAVERVARQLEGELRPPSQPSTNIAAVQLATVTNQAQAPVQHTNKPVVSPPVAKPPPSVTASTSLPPAHTAETPTASTSRAVAPPPTKVEVVQLTDDEPVKPARDVAPGSGAVSNAVRSQPVYSNNAVAKSTQPAAPDRYKYRSPQLARSGNRAEAERFVGQGVQAQERSRLSEAIEDYKKGAGADPSFFDAHYNLGVAAYESGDLAQTLFAYECALAVNPASVKARFNFAVALQKAGYPRDAANELETLLTYDRDEPRAHFALANLYAQQLGLTGKAREHYARVLALEPQHPQATAIRFWLEANK